MEDLKAKQTKTNNRNRSRGKSFERRVAERMGNWYRIPYSGSSELFGLGDVRDREGKEDSTWMMECKTLTPKSKTEINYIIKEEWLTGKTGVTGRAKKEMNKFWSLAFTKKSSAAIYVITSLEIFKTMARAIEILKKMGLISDQIDSTIASDQINDLWEEWRDK